MDQLKAELEDVKAQLAKTKEDWDEAERSMCNEREVSLGGVILKSHESLLT